MQLIVLREGASNPSPGAAITLGGMTTSEPPEPPPGDDRPAGEDRPVGEDTAAFRRYYLSSDAGAEEHGLLYRLFVGWWRKG